MFVGIIYNTGSIKGEGPQPSLEDTGCPWTKCDQSYLSQGTASTRKKTEQQSTSLTNASQDYKEEMVVPSNLKMLISL